MKHEITVKRGLTPWTTRFNVTSDIELTPERRCVEMILYQFPPEMLDAMRSHDIKVTVEIVKSDAERLREARFKGLLGRMTTHECEIALEIIERVDVEFAKENS